MTLRSGFSGLDFGNDLCNVARSCKIRWKKKRSKSKILPSVEFFCDIALRHKIRDASMHVSDVYRSVQVVSLSACNAT